jgi:hypothetical protein
MKGGPGFVGADIGVGGQGAVVGVNCGKYGSYWPEIIGCRASPVFFQRESEKNLVRASWL